MSVDDRRYNNQFRPEFSRLHRDKDLRWVVPFSVRYVIGISGERFAGKSSALAHLSEKRSFELYSLATTLREEAMRLGVPLEPRYHLQDLGDELRAYFEDPAYLARKTLRRIHRDHLDQRGAIEPMRRIAVGGFKRREELRLFEKLGRFAHLRIVASDEWRLHRARESGVGMSELSHLEPVPDDLDLEIFKREIDSRDLHGHDNPWTKGFGQEVEGLMEETSVTPVDNNATLADLSRLLDEKVRALDQKYRAFSA